MSEYGVEWETNILINGSDIKNVPIKKVFYKNGKITFTVENWIANRKKIRKYDCFQALEIQMGVFKSKANELDVREFYDACKNFMKKIVKLFSNAKIKIFEKEYDLLLYLENNKETHLYEDCSTSTPTNEKDGYAKGILYENIIGTPQLTFGIHLEKTISLFAYIANIYDPTRKNLQIETIYTTYIHTGYFGQQENMRDLSILSFLLLVGYYLLTSLVMKISNIKIYKKSFFAFKLRTNLRIIYDYVGKPEITLRKYVDYLCVKEGVNLRELSDEFLKGIHNPFSGVLVNNQILAKKYTTTDEKQNVKIFLPWWNNEQNYIDFGEWNMNNNLIHFEFRSIANFMAYKTKKPHQKFTNIHPSEFCGLIVFVIKTFLNPAFRIDENIILP